MAHYINKSGCSVMKDIILEFLENPTGDFEEFADEELECYGIQSLLNNVYMDAALDHLKSFLGGDANYPKEEGYEISKSGPVISANFVPGSPSGVELANGGDIIGGMHLHPKDGINMFSEEDIYNLYLLAKNTTNSPNDAFSVLDTANGTYMIKTKDLNSLASLFNYLSLKPKRARRNLKKRLKYKKNATATKYETAFLKVLNKLKTDFNLSKVPLTLYKVNTTGTNNTFNKIKLNAAGEPTPEPCE